MYASIAFLNAAKDTSSVDGFKSLCAKTIKSHPIHLKFLQPGRPKCSPLLQLLPNSNAVFGGPVIIVRVTLLGENQA